MKVKTRFGETAPITFNPEVRTRPRYYNWRDIRIGATIFLMNPFVNTLGLDKNGIHIEDPADLMVIPVNHD